MLQIGQLLLSAELLRPFSWLTTLLVRAKRLLLSFCLSNASSVVLFSLHYSRPPFYEIAHEYHVKIKDYV